MEAPPGEVTEWVLGVVAKAGEEGIMIKDLSEKFDIAFAGQTSHKYEIWQSLLASKHVTFADEVGVKALQKLGLDDILDLGLGGKKIKSVISSDVDKTDGGDESAASTTTYASSPIALSQQVIQNTERHSRPRKSDDQLSNGYHNKNPDNPGQIPDGVKKKRGRPRKAALDVPTQSITPREDQQPKRSNKRPDSRHDGEDAVFTTYAEMQRQSGVPGVYLDEEVQPRRRGGRLRDLSDNHILRIKSDSLKDKNWLTEHKGSWKTPDAAATSMNVDQHDSTPVNVNEFGMFGHAIPMDGFRQGRSEPVQESSVTERTSFPSTNDEQDQTPSATIATVTVPSAPTQAVAEAVMDMSPPAAPGLLSPLPVAAVPPPRQKRKYTRKVKAPVSTRTAAHVTTPVVVDGEDASAPISGRNSDLELEDFVIKRKADDSVAVQTTRKRRKLISGLEDKVVVSGDLTSIQEDSSSTVTVYKSQAQQAQIPPVEEGDFVQYEPPRNNLPVLQSNTQPLPQTTMAQTQSFGFQQSPFNNPTISVPNYPTFDPQAPRAYVSPYESITPSTDVSATAEHVELQGTLTQNKLLYGTSSLTPTQAPAIFHSTGSNIVGNEVARGSSLDLFTSLQPVANDADVALEKPGSIPASAYTPQAGPSNYSGRGPKSALVDGSAAQSMEDHPDRNPTIQSENMQINNDEETQHTVPLHLAPPSSSQLETRRQGKEARRKQDVDKKVEKERKDLELRERDEDLITRAAAVKLSPNATGLASIYNGSAGNLVLSADKTVVEFFGLEQSPPQTALFTMLVSEISGVPVTSTKGSYPMALIIKRVVDRKTTKHLFQYSIKPEAADSAAYMRSMLIESDPLKKARAGILSATVKQPKPWICGNCKKSFRGENGLAYHVSKARNPCNPTWVPVNKSDKPGRQKRAGLPKQREKGKRQRRASSPVEVDEDVPEGSPKPREKRKHQKRGAPEKVFEDVPDVESEEEGNLSRNSSSSRDSILLWAEKHATSGPGSKFRRARTRVGEAEWEPERDKPQRNAHQIGKRWYKNTPNEIQLLETLAKEIKDVVSMLEVDVSDRPVINLTTITDFQELILKVIRENGGCFPGERSMWLAVVSIWLKSQGPIQEPLQNLPESKHCKRAVDELVDLQKLQRYCFEFESTLGKSKKLPRQILLEPGFDAASPLVEDIKAAFAKEYPQVYVPSEYHLPGKTWNRLQLNARDLAAIARKDKRDDSFDQQMDSDGSDFGPQDIREGDDGIDDDSDVSIFTSLVTDEDVPGDDTNQPVSRKNRNSQAKGKWIDGVYQRPPRSENSKARASNALTGRWVDVHAKGVRLLSAAAIPSTIPKRVRRQHEEETDKRMARARKQMEEKIPTVTWAHQPALLLDPESGAWSISTVPNELKAGVGRSWGRPKLPEPVTYLQSSNGAWNQRPFGHGANPVFSRPARFNAIQTQSGIEYLKRKYSGHRPVVYPPKANDGPRRGQNISALEMYPDMEVPSWALGDSTEPSKAKQRPSALKGADESRRGSSTSVHFADEDEFEAANRGDQESDFNGKYRRGATGQPARKRRRTVHQNTTEHGMGPEPTFDDHFDPRKSYVSKGNGKRHTKTSRRAAENLDSLDIDNWDDEIDTLRPENPGLRTLPAIFGLEDYGLPDVETQITSGYSPEKYPLQYVDMRTTFEDCDFGEALSWKYGGWSVPRAPNFRVRFQKKTSYTMSNLPYEEIADENANFIAPVAGRRKRGLSISESGPVIKRVKHAEDKYYTARIQTAARNDFEGVEDPNYPSAAFDMKNFADKFTAEELAEWFEPSQLANIFNDNQLAAIFEPSRLTNLVRTNQAPIPFREIDRNQVPAMFGIEMSQQVVGPTRSSKLAVISMGNVDERRFIASCVALRTLLGGLEGQLDMVILAKIIPGYEVNALMKHWANLQESYPSTIEMIEQDFQSSFPEAYAKGEVPSIDYDNQVNCDWDGIVRWFLANIDVTLDRNSKTMNLPGTRRALNEMYELTVLDSDASNERKQQLFNYKTPNNRRMDFLARSTNSLAVKEPGGNDDDAEVDDLVVAKSRVRAVALTPSADWDQDVAAVKLREFGVEVIEQATTDLMNEKAIRKINKGRPTPGRAYLPTDFFKSKFKRTIPEHNFHVALSFKQFLDAQFSEYPNRPVRVSLNADEGTIMCITSLQAAGQVRFDATNVVADKMNGLYEPKTTTVRKENMFFDIDLYPTTSYIPNNQNVLITNIKSATPPQSSDAGELPAWIGITDRTIHEIWRNVVTAVTQTVAQRAGIDMDDLMGTFSPSLEAWELKRLMAWGEEMGLFSRLSPRIPGWTVGEGWWLAVGVVSEMYHSQ